nr:MAG TPA: Glycophorin A [Caudoviricetes sp.]
MRRYAALITILMTVIIAVNVAKGSSAEMCEIDYEAAGILGTIATISYCITQASNTGIIFECHNWLNSFEIRVFPNKNNLDHFFYLDEQGRAVFGRHTTIKVTTENCTAILEKLKEY